MILAELTQPRTRIRIVVLQKVNPIQDRNKDRCTTEGKPHTGQK